MINGTGAQMLITSMKNNTSIRELDLRKAINQHIESNHIDKKAFEENPRVYF